MTMILETERLRLFELTVEDAGFVFRLVGDPDFRTHIGDKGIRTLDDARRFLGTGPWTNQPRPGYGQFRVELKDTGESAGICGLLYRERLDASDVGFALLPAFRGRGFAFEAAAATMAYGRKTLGIERIVALTSHENLPSIRLLEKLGMRFEKTVHMSDSDPGTALFA